MTKKPTYEELEQRIKELGEESVKRKRAEEALQDEAVRRRILVEQSKDGIVVLNQNGKVFEANQRYAELLGYTMEEVLQLYVWDWDTQWTQDQLLEMLQAIDETGDHFETRHRRKDGTYYDVEISTNGAVCGGQKLIFCVCRDITERKQAVEALKEAYDQLDRRVEDRTSELVKANEQLQCEIAERVQAEEALRESEKRFRTLFDYAGDAIAIHDLDGHFLEVNQELCKRLGYSLEEMLQMTPMDIDTSEYSAIVSERIEELHRRGQAFFETAHTRRDGSIIPIEVNSRIIELAGKPAVLSVARDITERKRAEEEKKVLEAKLQQAQKMEAIGTLAGGIAHDFNNLLMAIQGHSSLLMMHIDSDHPHFERLKGIQDMIQTGAGLTKQLLGFARGGKYEVKPTDPNGLIEQSCEMFGRTQKNIEINRKYQKGIWPVEVDRGQIHQVLLNLYVNAWHAMSGGGYIYIETSNVMLDENDSKSFNLKPGKYVKISVTDNGAGMDKTTQQKILTRFLRPRIWAVGQAWAWPLPMGSSRIIVASSMFTVKGVKEPPLPFTCLLQKRWCQ